MFLNPSERVSIFAQWARKLKHALLDQKMEEIKQLEASIVQLSEVSKTAEKPLNYELRRVALTVLECAYDLYNNEGHKKTFLTLEQNNNLHSVCLGWHGQQIVTTHADLSNIGLQNSILSIIQSFIEEQKLNAVVEYDGDNDALGTITIL